MSSREEFLRQIIADPSNNDLRFVFADWLEERSDPQAELIRVQCDLDAGVGDSRGLREREQNLLLEHGEQWSVPLKPFVESHRFIRGLIGHIRIEGPKFFAELTEILSRAPIESVALDHSQDSRFTEVSRTDATQFAQHCGNVHTLSLATDAGSLSRMAVSGALAGVRRLDLAYSYLDGGSLRDLLTACAEQLITLSLRDVFFDDLIDDPICDWVLALLEANWQQCEVVDLRGCWLDRTDRGMLEATLGSALVF